MVEDNVLPQMEKLHLTVQQGGKARSFGFPTDGDSARLWMLTLGYRSGAFTPILKRSMERLPQQAP